MVACTSHSISSCALAEPTTSWHKAVQALAIVGYPEGMDSLRSSRAKVREVTAHDLQHFSLTARLYCMSYLQF